MISSTASMFNADDVETGTVAVCVCVCVCHGACLPVLKNIQLPYKECGITVTRNWNCGGACVCVCHGACPPVLKNIQLLYKECGITVTSVSISVSDKERRLRVSISTVSQNTRPLFTHIHAQKHNH